MLISILHIKIKEFPLLATEGFTQVFVHYRLRVSVLRPNLATMVPLVLWK